MLWRATAGAAAAFQRGSLCGQRVFPRSIINSRKSAGKLWLTMRFMVDGQAWSGAAAQVLLTDSGAALHASFCTMLHLGVQCSLESCKTVDFLPILCQCNKYFCRDHIQLDAHPCTAASSNNLSNHKAQKLALCDFKNCQKPSL